PRWEARADGASRAPAREDSVRKETKLPAEGRLVGVKRRPPHARGRHPGYGQKTPAELRPWSMVAKQRPTPQPMPAFPEVNRRTDAIPGQGIGHSTLRHRAARSIWSNRKIPQLLRRHTGNRSGGSAGTDTASVR